MADTTQGTGAASFEKKRTWPNELNIFFALIIICLLYTSPSPRDKRQSRMPSSA